MRCAIALSMLALFAMTTPSPLAAQTPAAVPAIELVTLPSPGSPLVAVRLLFRVGSIDDPAGKEGLAALTGRMIADAGTAKRSYKELLDAFFPMASGLTVATDRELTVVAGEIHRDRLAEWTALVVEAVTAPGFAEADFNRHREQLRAYLTTTLRAANDELLGLEAIQQRLYAGHPYAHAPAGTLAGLAAISLDDVRAFYRERFTRARLTLGVAGGYPEGYPAELAGALAALAPGGATPVALPPPPAPEGRRVSIVEKKTDSVGIHFGFPLAITRADADYYPLLVAVSFLGEHRTFHGRLMQQLRGLRGLNYGDYAYLEHYANPPQTATPTPNVARRQQYFSVWLRPVVRGTERFALRNALYEVDRLIAQGMTKEQFELTREFLVNYSKLWQQTLSRRLGFAMDSRFYATPDFIAEIETRLAKLTVAEVNAALRKHLQTANLEILLVADRAAELQAALASETPSPMTYPSPPPPEVLAADQTIATLPLRPTAIRILPVAEMFEK